MKGEKDRSVREKSDAEARSLATDVLWEALNDSGGDRFMALWRAEPGRSTVEDAALIWTARRRAAWAVQKGAHLSEERHECFPALAATDMGDAELLSMLAAAGAPLEKEGNLKGACVRAAARLGKADVLAVLLKAGVSPDARPSPFFATALISACRGTSDKSSVDFVEALLRAGADIEARVESVGITPLIAAARCGNQAVCEKLIEHGADINARLINGPDAASEARDAGYGQLAFKLAVLKEAQILSAEIRAAPGRRRKSI